MAKFANFMKDEDGFSAKDFLMIVFTSLFVIFTTTAFFFSLKGKLNPQALEIIKSMDGVLMTIVGGVFSVQVVKEFRKPKDEGHNDDYSYRI